MNKPVVIDVDVIEKSEKIVRSWVADEKSFKDENSVAVWKFTSHNSFSPYPTVNVPDYCLLAIIFTDYKMFACVSETGHDNMSRFLYKVQRNFKDCIVIPGEIATEGVNAPYRVAKVNVAGIDQSVVEKLDKGVNPLLQALKVRDMHAVNEAEEV